jgi:hypothetical protein
MPKKTQREKNKDAVIAFAMAAPFGILGKDPGPAIGLGHGPFMLAMHDARAEVPIVYDEVLGYKVASSIAEALPWVLTRQRSVWTQLDTMVMVMKMIMDMTPAISPQHQMASLIYHTLAALRAQLGALQNALSA